MTEEVLFHAVLAQPPADRAGYLAQHCSDPALRGAVEELLAAHDRPAGPLDAPAHTGAYSPSVPPAADPTGTPGMLIGPYKLLQLIGEGGMGSVWMAEQERPVRRRVAVKVIKPGMDSRQVIARFEAERQALAMMDHQNIAKVLDAGATPEGRPFFVMELIRGEPITKFCDDNHLTPRERLELFVPVCQAVQHAHQKGVIHRDLKPSNVLVTLYDGRPVPKVIDFGVAKALHQRLTDKTMFTEFGAAIGTLEYMAPEQAELSHLDVDTRSDIYSLGVLLYELLTGSTPLDRKRLQSAAYDEILRIIREEEPPKPSTRLSASVELPSIAAQRKTEPAKLSKLVRGEIDWIVMKALEKDRTRRYETANGLARDIQRHLDDEPVEACPPSAGYRLRKFVRRYKGPVVAAALLTIALTAGVVGTTIGLVRAEGARRRAVVAEAQANDERKRAEAAQRQAMSALRATTDDVIEQLIGEKPTLGPSEKAFLEATLQRWQAFAAGQGDGEQARAIRAEGVQRVAALRRNLGQTAESLAGCREAITLLTGLAADFPANPEHRLNLARGQTDLARLLETKGRPVEAEAAARAALALLEPLAADSRATPEVRLAFARGYIRLGNMLQLFRAEPPRPIEAADAFQRALAVLQPLVAEFPAMPTYREVLANAFQSLGTCCYRFGPSAEAEPACRRAIALYDRLTAEFPTLPAYRSGLAWNWLILGNCLGNQTERGAAYRRSVDLYERLVADFPAVPTYRSDLAWGHFSLGVALDYTGKPVEAEAACRRAAALHAQLAAEFPTVPGHRRGLAADDLNLSHLLFKSDRDTEAMAVYRRSSNVQQQLADDFPDIYRYRETLFDHHWRTGLLLEKLGKRSEALAAFGQALAATEKVAADCTAKFGPDQGQTLDALKGVADCLVKLGRGAEAVPIIDECLQRSSAKPDGSDRMRDLLHLRVHYFAGRHDAAGCRQSAELWESLNRTGPDNFFVAACWRGVGVGVLRRTSGEAAARLAAAEGDRAMAWLRMAFAAGYHDVPHMLQEYALIGVRSRADYADLLWDLADQAN